MKITLILCFVSIMMFPVISCRSVEVSKDLVRYVDPNIGGVGALLQPTVPVVQLPNSMIRLAPRRTPNVLDKYLAPKIYEFPMSITSHRIAEAFAVMPVSGVLTINMDAAASEYDHQFETTTPYYYRVLLERSDIMTEFTVTEHAEIFRLGFSRPETAHMLFRSHKQGMIEVVGNTIVRGVEQDENVMYYFYAEFDTPFSAYGTAAKDSVTAGSPKIEGNQITTYVSFPGTGARTVMMKIGISYISMDQAQQNCAQEIHGWDFDAVKDRGRDIWNLTLSKIKVEGGTEREKRIFYTALYRSHERMVNISETNGKYYSAFDHQVHEDGGHPFYVDDWLWDTFRSLHSLQMLLNPHQKSDMIQSYIRMTEQNTWMPAFPIVRGDHACMIGHHAASLIADAYAKGVRGYDIEKAYAGLRKTLTQSTMLPWANGPLTELDSVYFATGFFPARAPGQKEWVPQVHSWEKRQAVAVTLELSYDAWCAAQLAKALGKNEDYAMFSKLAMNYVNVYNPRTGFMSPKTADGKWIEPFDTKLGGGQGGRDYFAECNAWTYTWSVQHDVQGLINLMGGRAQFIARLDGLFNEGYNTDKFFFLGQFPDATGLNGQFAMGDEPSFHIPYLYNYAGAPWRTQKTLRQLMDVWFDDDVHGICGDEDGGALSSWYVFNAMGFYPVTPGVPAYNIGTPVFEKSTITLVNGKEFVITAKGASMLNKYIQSASLNGTPLTKPWFNHGDIANGGSLELVMGSRPNKAWGAAPEDAPPSMSTLQQTVTPSR